MDKDVILSKIDLKNTSHWYFCHRYSCLLCSHDETGSRQKHYAGQHYVEKHNLWVPMKFIDRCHEFARLDRLATSSRGGLAILWGRRRFGKAIFLDTQGADTQSSLRSDVFYFFPYGIISCYWRS